MVAILHVPFAIFISVMAYCLPENDIFIWECEYMSVGVWDMFSGYVQFCNFFFCFLSISRRPLFRCIMFSRSLVPLINKYNGMMMVNVDGNDCETVKPTKVYFCPCAMCMYTSKEIVCVNCVMFACIDLAQKNQRDSISNWACTQFFRSYHSNTIRSSVRMIGRIVPCLYIAIIQTKRATQPYVRNSHKIISIDRIPLSHPLYLSMYLI